MKLDPYIENVHRQLAAAVSAGGEETRALAEQLAPALESAIRLALQDVLAAAVDEITLELAPAAVELRLRGRDPEFVVSTPLEGEPADAHDEPRRSIDSAEAGQGAMSRINLRMPEQLRTRIEAAAAAAGLSVNAWLVRAAAAAADRSEPQDHGRAAHGSHRYTGWAR
jgi:hypothetical protein